jgi:hypothetical protein
MPAEAMATYARWWQLETWLRSLIYVELRARYGEGWVDHIDPTATSRQTRDAAITYMSTPDGDDPLAYLDAGKLLDLIDTEWEIFEESLLPAKVWTGRRPELIGIRNRIGHLRRPNPDDLNRLQQTLSDLEPGALKAVLAYNDLNYVYDGEVSDPVADVWANHKDDEAKHLVEHALSHYGVELRLAYTVRPWAANEPSGDLTHIAGRSGFIWRAAFHLRDSYVNIERLWKDYPLDSHARPLVIHMIADITQVDFTFAAVDNPDSINSAIREALDAVLYTAYRGLPSKWQKLSYEPLDHLPPLDPRVQTRSVWATVHPTPAPPRIFSV